MEFTCNLLISDAKSESLIGILPMWGRTLDVHRVVLCKRVYVSCILHGDARCII